MLGVCLQDSSPNPVLAANKAGRVDQGEYAWGVGIFQIKLIRGCTQEQAGPAKPCCEQCFGNFWLCGVGVWPVQRHDVCQMSSFWYALSFLQPKGLQYILSDYISVHTNFIMVYTGRHCSNLYEVNQWLWQFGRGKPRLGGLNVEETAQRKEADCDAWNKSGLETRQCLKEDQTWFKVKCACKKCVCVY